MNLPTTGGRDQTTGHGGLLRCETCGDRRRVRATYWRTGWPKCCDQTMRWWTARQITAGDMPDLNVNDTFRQGTR